MIRIYKDSVTNSILTEEQVIEEILSETEDIDIADWASENCDAGELYLKADVNFILRLEIIKEYIQRLKEGLRRGLYEPYQYLGRLKT